MKLNLNIIRLSSKDLKQLIEALELLGEVRPNTQKDLARLIKKIVRQAK